MRKGLYLLPLLFLSQVVLSQQFVFERGYSTTYVETNKTCDLDEYASMCKGYANFLAGSFENAQLQRFNSSIDYEDPDFVMEIPHAEQHLLIDFRPFKDNELITVVTHIEIKDSAGEDSYIETMNLNEKTGKLITFKDLFKKPDIASMICARKIEARYKEVNMSVLPLVVASVEVNPTRFLIMPDGIEFVYPPNLLEKSNNDSVLKVHISELMEASPNLNWFPGFLEKNIKHQEDQLDKVNRKAK